MAVPREYIELFFERFTKLPHGFLWPLVAMALECCWQRHCTSMAANISYPKSKLTITIKFDIFQHVFICMEEVNGVRGSNSFPIEIITQTLFQGLEIRLVQCKRHCNRSFVLCWDVVGEQTMCFGRAK